VVAILLKGDLMKKLGFIFLLISTLAFGRTSDQAYIMPHTGNVPTWGQLDLSQTAATKNQLLNSRGGTGLNSSASTGIAHVSSGTWSVSSIVAGDIASDAVTTAKILDGNVTQAKRVALGQQLSSSCASFSVTSDGSDKDVTNLSVTITTTGRPVYVGVISVSNSTAYFASVKSSSTNPTMYVNIVRASSTISVSYTDIQGLSGSGNGGVSIPVSSVNTIDVVAAGTYTYKISMNAGSSGYTLYCSNAKLIAYEL
jgi:hypothetical protein